MFKPHDTIERYRLVSLLGSGGMGEVWLAEEGDSGLYVALKLPTDPDYISQLRREGKLQLALDHPNIVKVHRLAIEHEPPFVVMEYVEGKSLRAVMKEKGALSLEQAVRFTTHILNGLAAAHRRGVVHRDIKPENVLIGVDGRAKITDFGLGKVVQDLSISLLATGSMISSAGGSIAGTYDYMSPEQRAGKEIGPQADVYAVGLILFELLTGARASGSLRRILQRRNVPESLIALIMKATEPQENRFADAMQFQRALKEATEHISPEQMAMVPRSHAELGLPIPPGPVGPIGKRPEQAPPPPPPLPPSPPLPSSPLSPGAPEPSRPLESWLDSAVATTDLDGMESGGQAAQAGQPDSSETEPLAAAARSRQKKPSVARNLILAAAVIAVGAGLIYGMIEFMNRGAENRAQAPTAGGEVTSSVKTALLTTATAIGAASSSISSETATISPAVARRTTGTLVATASAALSLGGPAVGPSPTGPRFLFPTPPPRLTPIVRTISTVLPVPDPERPLQKSFLMLGRGVQMDLVWIVPNAFQMGSPPTEVGRQPDEGPFHWVTLDGFWMGETEVTQAQYQQVMGGNPSQFKGAELPVENVSWADAMEFCRKASLMTNKTVTLPTEAQWEYACRAGSSSRFFFGDVDTGLGEYAWYAGNAGSRTHPVRTRRPSALGLYDMEGNVAEFCSDWYGPYALGRQINPAGPANGQSRVMRGGSFGSLPTVCRSACRLKAPLSLRNNSVGFRCAVVNSIKDLKP